MIDPDDTGDLKADVARLLALARMAMKLEQESFGEGAGLSQPRYNQYETGRRLLTLDAAMSLCERYSLTLDWIYRGDPSGLPVRLWDEIKAKRQSFKRHAHDSVHNKK